MTRLRATALLGGMIIAAACASGGAPSANTGARPMSSYPPRNLSSLRPLTRAERTGFRETSTHADVMAFIDSLSVSTESVRLDTLGHSPAGRAIPVVIASRPAVRTPSEARRLNRPIVFIQGNIHGGEVEGKEALLAILRDLTNDRYANVLDSLVIVAVPIYNVDGNDSLGPQQRNRGSQNGPAMVGLRANGQGLDLNRDCIKAEAPETRAALEWFRVWDPDVFVDLHTTNGSFHGYALTWAPTLHPAARVPGPFTRDTILPDLQATLRQRLRLETFPYGNFVSQDSVERGWFTYDHRPRFGTNYVGLRGRIGILSEAYSHDPFDKRVASTYGFVMELLSILSEHGEDFLESSRVADLRTTGYGTPGTSPPIAIRARLTTKPRTDNVLVEEIVRTPGDTTRSEPGLRPGVRRTGRFRSVRMPIYDRFEPALEQTVPYAWLIPAAQGSLVEHLQRHGVILERAEQAIPVRAEHFLIDSVVRQGQPFQGHQEVRLEGRWAAPDTMMLEPSAWIVRGSQALGLLALYLLEPQSDDGFVTWNFLDSSLPAPGAAGGARYPIARVLDRIPVRLNLVR